MLKRLNSTAYIILALTLVTAIIHLYLGVNFGDTLFLLNGLGYIVLAIALYFVPALAAQRNLIRWLFILFTAVTVILYFVMNPDPMSSGFGLFTKAIELVLIILLFVDRNN